MSLVSVLKAVVRGASRPFLSEGEQRLGAGSGGDLLVAQGMLPKAEIVRLGKSWYTAIPTGSAFTPVAAMPTTRSELTLRNSYTDGQTCLVIDAIGIMSLTSLAAVTGATIVTQVNAAAALTDNAAVLISSPTGGTYGGSATRALATTTAVANKWMAHAASGSIGASTTTIGSGICAEIAGGIVLFPGFTLHTNVVLSTAAGTAIAWVSWHEQKLTF